MPRIIEFSLHKYGVIVSREVGVKGQRTDGRTTRKHDALHTCCWQRHIIADNSSKNIITKRVFFIFYNVSFKLLYASKCSRTDVSVSRTIATSQDCTKRRQVGARSTTQVVNGNVFKAGQAAGGTNSSEGTTVKPHIQICIRASLTRHNTALAGYALTTTTTTTTIMV